MVRQCVDVSPHSQPTRHTGDVGTLNTDRCVCDLHLKMVFRMRCGSAHIYRKHQTDANKHVFRGMQHSFHFFATQGGSSPLQIKQSI